MANPIKGEVVFEASGQTYTVVYSIDAICTLETMLDKPLRQIAQQIDQGRITAQRAALWAGLHERHPKVTLREAGELIPLIKGRNVGQVFAEAVKLAFASDDAEDGGASETDPR